MDESPETQDAPETDTDVLGRPDAGAGDATASDEALEDAAPVVGGAADLGEPMTPMGETLQVGVDVPGGQDVAETGAAVLQDPTDDEPLGSTIDAIGTGPTGAVTVQAEEEEPLPGVALGGAEAAAMADVADATQDSPTTETETETETETPDVVDAVEEIETVEAIEDEMTEEVALPASEQDKAAETDAPVEPIAPEQVAETTAEEDEIAAAEAEEAARSAARDPMRGPGDWYVVHTYAGYENKVKTNLESRIHTMQMEDKIFRVHIPMEDVMEIKGGKKQVVQRKVFPGYLLVKMVYDNDSWYVVRNTPGVTGFVAAGTGSKPTPLSRREVEKILVVKKEEVKPQFRLGFEENDVVRIISGPFADFNGTISEINLDQSKLKVLVNIFDRETPVELSFDQVAKV
jgi:transcription termination/antitermination protein NusG